MACHKPLGAYKAPDGSIKIGRGAIDPGHLLELPCGQCVGCKKDRARAWSLRIGHEAQLWDSNYFVTLDYAPEHLRSLSLEYVDFQLFLKRLRKKFKGHMPGPNGDYPIRFFVAGEYGARYRRPHWHCILFNLLLTDLKRFQNDTLQSDVMDDLWGKGRVVIGSVTPQSAAYVAGYVNKKVYGQGSSDYYEDVVDVNSGEVFKRRPEFVVMSLKPGIGAWWYDRYKKDLFTHDVAVRDGKKYKVPRYYFERFKKDPSNAARAEEIEYERYLKSQAMPVEEKSLDRRMVKEEYDRRMMDFLKERDLDY